MRLIVVFLASVLVANATASPAPPPAPVSRADAYFTNSVNFGQWLERQCRSLGDPPVRGYSYVTPDAEELYDYYNPHKPKRYLGSQGFEIRCGRHTYVPAGWKIDGDF